MANSAVRERLSQDLSLWLADGLVSKDTHDLLRLRFGAREFGIANAIKSLGIAGGVIAFFGLLGLVAALSRSQTFAALLLLTAGAALTVAGIRLSRDKLGRYALSSKAVLMLGVVTAAIGIGVALDELKITGRPAVLLTGCLIILPIGYLAYRFRNTFLLSIGLIALFHWIGSWTGMLGRSTYAMEIQDPRIMTVAALAAVMVGIYHEQKLQVQTGRFFQAYETLGLIYLNLSQLILGIEWGQHGEIKLWIALWFVAALLQIVGGARLHSLLLTGFGVTAFALNVYTRYYDTFWNLLDTGVFFLLGGAALFAAGFACETILRRWQTRPV